MNSCQNRNITKILIVFIVLLSVLVLALFIFVLQNGLLNQLKPKECLTVDCIRCSARIITLIDPEKNPCHNFNSFVCPRKSLAKHRAKLKSHQSFLTTEINYLITDTSENHNDVNHRNQKQFYRNCLVQDYASNTDAFLDVIEQLSSWPVLRGRYWDERKFHWFTFLTQTQKIGLKNDIFLKIHLENASNILRLAIDPPDNFPFSLNQPEREAHITLMTNVGVQLGASIPQAENEFIRVFQFEEQLGKIINEASKRVWLQHETLKELEAKFQLGWVDFANNFTGSHTFNPESGVTIGNPDYLNKLISLLNATPKKVQANFLIWKLIVSLRHHLTPKIQSIFAEVFDQNSTVFHLPNFCLQNAKTLFPSVAEVALIRKYVSNEKQTEIKEMLHRIKHHIILSINATKWLDTKIKNQTINYIHEMKHIIAMNAHAQAEISFESSGNFLENILKLTAEQNKDYFKFINRNIDELKRYQLENLPILDSSKLSQENTIILGLVQLDEPFFVLNRPNYVNYAALGGLVARQIATNLIFYVNKKLPQDNLKKLETKASQCLQNSNYTLKSKSKMSDAFLGQISEIIAFNMAFGAYQDWKKFHLNEAPLVGVNYTQNQIFSIVYGGVGQCYELAGKSDTIKMTSFPNGNLLNAFDCPSNEKNCNLFAS